MRRRWGLALAACLGLAVAASAEDGGGRDVTVALFSALRVTSVTIAPGGDGAWTAACARCARKPLTAMLHVSGAMEILAGGALRVTDDGSGVVRAAAGLWHLQAAGERGADVVLTIPSERYVAAVLNAEAATDEPAESLRALAIVARTYALNGKHFTAASGHLDADLCDSTECEAMRLGPPSAAIEDAVRATAGETLWFRGRRAEVYFSQHCGGITENAGAVWPKLRGLPYLASHADAYCLRRDAAAWHAEIPLTSITEVAKSEGWHLPPEIVSAQVAERSASHRAVRVQFTGKDGKTALLAASALRFGIGRALGWNRVRSDAYQVGVRHGTLVFDGRGHGHGVGLCQAGAAEMAGEDKNARAILAFYFPGTAVRILPGDEGWNEFRAGDLAVRTVQPPTEARRSELRVLWQEAKKRFPPHNSITPAIVFAPTTELFRQMTAEPGWMLAATRGGTMVLQPEAVLRALGREENATIRHEMLHVLVESECSDRTPLWLREGLVEVLNGEHILGAPTMPVSTIEGMLRHPESQSASEDAHRQAAARVHLLMSRYGASAVRGWLSSGVPAGVS